MFATAETMLLFFLGIRFIRNFTLYSIMILKSIMPVWQWLRSAALNLDAL